MPPFQKDTPAASAPIIQPSPRHATDDSYCSQINLNPLLLLYRKLRSSKEKANLPIYVQVFLKMKILKKNSGEYFGDRPSVSVCM